MSKRSLRLALLLAAPFLASACTSSPHANMWGDHWGIESVPERVTKHFTGYRYDLNPSYIDYQYRKKKDIDLTLRRHFANNNPDNPFEPEDPSRVQRRPPHSLAPDPLHYLHVESLVFGVITLGWTGAFIPIPVDSLIATIDGGWGEFGKGFANTFTGHSGEEAQNPPAVREFKVKHH